ncbi:Epithelial sodium channel [Trinorchestia longiramus]|nr:Epithelial sodium channel [Trinorchestia longiramus]
MNDFPSSVFDFGCSDDCEEEETDDEETSSISDASTTEFITTTLHPESERINASYEATSTQSGKGSTSSTYAETNSEKEDDSNQLNRTKRSTTSGYGNMTMPLWKQEARSRCSLVFQSQLQAASSTSSSLPTLHSFGVTLGDLSQCTDKAAWGVTAVQSFYYQPCGTDVFSDLLGMYLDVTTEFEMNDLSDGKTTSSCKEGSYKAARVYKGFDTKQSTSSVKRYITQSLTNDISDILWHFNPSFDVLKNVSREDFEFIEICSIDGTHCDHREFFEYMTNDLGVCYTFNSPHVINKQTKNMTIDDRRKKFTPRSSYSTGPLTGLRLTLNLHTSKQVSMLSSDVGLRVVLHEPWVAPFPDTQGFNLAPGMSHSVAISRTVIDRIGEPHGKCTSDNTYMFDYSEAMCLELCHETEYMRLCGCYNREGVTINTLLSKPEFQNVNYTRCNTISTSGALCVAAVYALLNNDSFDCGCHPSCHEVRYDAQVSATNGNKEFLKVVQNVKGVAMGSDLCGEEDSVVRVHFYLKSNEYEEIKESAAYTGNTLISNMGGNLGLFLGMSLLSIFEVLDYLVDVLLILLVPRWFHRSRTPLVQVKPRGNSLRKIVIFAGPSDFLPRDTSLRPKKLQAKEKMEESFKRVFLTSNTSNLDQSSAETEAREASEVAVASPTNKLDGKTVQIPYKEPSWSAVPPKGYNFEVLKGGVVFQTVPFDKPYLVFGRLAQCDVMLEHPSISRFHCIVQYRGVASEAAGAGIYVYDLSSTHGTYQNKNRLQPKVYNRLKVGHMLKLGGSSRNFLLMGPDEDAEEELPYSVAELREMAKKKEEEKRLKAEQERKRKDDEEQQRIKAEAERGIDWGMGPDAEEVEEEDADAPNPFSDMVREELYLDDPKKSLRGWYEREGYDLPEYDVTEITSGRFKCTVKLPVLSTSGEPLLATVDHRGKKKDTVVQAALEACRLLDKQGLFRQATHASRAVKAAVESDSDEEDEFLDRTGDVARKRDRRYVRSAKREKAYTYEELREQHSTALAELQELGLRLLEAQRAKEALASKDSEKETEDLDIFMRSMNKLALDKHKMLTWKLKFIEMRKEEARLRRLLNVARPADVAEAQAPSFPPELILPGSQRSVDKKLTVASASSKTQQSSAGAKNVSSGVHAAFLEEDEAPKLKLSKLDTSEDFVPKSIPYDRSVYSSVPRPRPRPARPPAKYVVFDDEASQSNNNSSDDLTSRSMLRQTSDVHEAESQNESFSQETNASGDAVQTRNTSEMTQSSSPERSSVDAKRVSHDSEDCSSSTVTESKDSLRDNSENISSKQAPEETLTSTKRVIVDINSDFLPSGTKKRKTMGADQQASLRAAVQRASSGAQRGASKKKTPQFFDFDDPRAEEDWVPPQGQTGDGRTVLNDKLGY